MCGNFCIPTICASYDFGVIGFWCHSPKAQRFPAHRPNDALCCDSDVIVENLDTVRKVNDSADLRFGTAPALEPTEADETLTWEIL